MVGWSMGRDLQSGLTVIASAWLPKASFVAHNLPLPSLARRDLGFPP